MRRVLSIDGGGIKGVFATSFLATIEDAVGVNPADYFDLIVGTSTGGLIALGLGLGMSARDICGMYEEMGPSVFGRRGRMNFLRSFVFSRYRNDALRRALESQFGKRRLGESKKRLVIPSVNLETGKIHIYKTSHHPKFEVDYQESVVDVALATTAAPVYFPTHQSASGLPLIDGGIWANNPTGVAAVEAVGVLNWPREEVRILSLGCTATPFDAGVLRRGGFGWAFWAPKIVDIFMAAQSSAAEGTAATLVGHENLKRISPTVPRARFGLDNIREIKAMSGLGASFARDELPGLRVSFLTEPRAEEFKPYHQL